MLQIIVLLLTQWTQEDFRKSGLLNNLESSRYEKTIQETEILFSKFHTTFYEVKKKENSPNSLKKSLRISTLDLHM